MGSFGIDWPLLLSQVVNFGLLAFLLTVVLFKPIMSKLDERADKIRHGVEDADQAEKLVAEADQHYRDEIDRARREAREMLERITRGAEQQREEILAAARIEADEILDRAREQARREIREGKIALREQVVDLAITAAGRILENDLDDTKHHQLVDDFVHDMYEQTS